jgi:hypothetical protein
MAPWSDLRLVSRLGDSQFRPQTATEAERGLPTAPPRTGRRRLPASADVPVRTLHHRDRALRHRPDRLAGAVCAVPVSRLLARGRMSWRSCRRSSARSRRSTIPSRRELGSAEHREALAPAGARAPTSRNDDLRQLRTPAGMVGAGADRGGLRSSSTRFGPGVTADEHLDDAAARGRASSSGGTARRTLHPGWARRRASRSFGVALFSAFRLHTRPTSYFAQGGTGIVVIDLSASVDPRANW